MQDFEIRDISLPPEQVQAMYDSSIAKIPSIRAQQEMLKRQQVIDPLNIATAKHGAILLPSSQAGSAALQVENAFDGNFETSYVSSPGSFPNWVELRWPQPVTLAKLLVNESPVHKTAEYRIDVYQNRAWAPQVPAKVNARKPGEQIVEAFLSPVTTTKIRYVMLRPENADVKTACSSIAEIQACSASPVPDLSAIARPSWKSHWIWYPEPTAVDVTRYFRAHFKVADPAQVQRAVLQIGVDDAYEIYLNGRHVGSGGIPTDKYEVAKLLRAGDNVIAGKARNQRVRGLICSWRYRRRKQARVSDGVESAKAARRLEDYCINW